MKALESKSHILLLGINYREHKTNIYIKEKINHTLGSLCHYCQKKKVVLVYHVLRSNRFAKNIQQGKIEGAIPRGCPKMEWMENIYKWTSKDLGDLLMMTKYRNKWRRCCVKYSYSLYDLGVMG